MQLKTMQVIGAVLILVGLLFALNMTSFATLVVDTTPPTFGGSCPSDGVTYTAVTSISIYVYDAESGVKSVTCQIDSTTYTLSPHKTEPDLWVASGGTTAVGTHTFQFTATNNAGLTSKKSGTFTIYTQLQGNWYIADQQITNTSQTVYVTTTSVSFKFQKTAGISDSYISCWVEEGGTKILTLTLIDTTNHIWTGSYTFSPGTHNLALIAYDGTQKVTMSIVGLEFGQGPSTLPSLSNSQLLGIGLLVVGCVLVWKGKRK
jgi:hypothetical protein